MDVQDEVRCPFLRWEKFLIVGALKEGLPILGVCLGAQLMAKAARAGIYQSGVKEIGWYPVSLTTEGQMDPVLGYLPERPMGFQCDTGGFALPKGAKKLASSPGCENQAFRLGTNAYALQFHLEITPAMVDRWVKKHREDLIRVQCLSTEKIRIDTQSYSAMLAYCGERFFSKFLERISDRWANSDLIVEG